MEYSYEIIDIFVSKYYGYPTFNFFFATIVKENWVFSFS